jgi:cytochrome c
LTNYRTDRLSELHANTTDWQENIVSRRPLAFVSVGALALLLSGASAVAQQLGTGEEAKAMLDRAIAALKSNEAIALGEFNDPNNKQFYDRDLFVFCYEMSDGKITAYSSPALLGVDIRTLTLKDDLIGQRTFDAVQNLPPEAVATIEYIFSKPGTNLSAPMQFLEAHVNEQACGVAYYK